MTSVEVARSSKRLIIPAGHWPEEPIGILPDGRQVVPHDMSNTRLLRQVGHDVPHPMELYYDWPHEEGKPPFEVQRRSAYMLAASPRAYLLNQQGTGKTNTSLWAWDFLYGEGTVGKLLVVAKLSTVNFVWRRAVDSTLPRRKCVVLASDKGMSKPQRLKLLAEEADIYIINHDGIKVIQDELAARRDIDTLVLDELAVYRNNSDRSKGMRDFAKRFKYVWGLTGSPIPNEVTDVWSQCKIITPHTVPQYFRACREMLMTRVSQYEWRPRPEARERALAMMQPSLRYSLEDVTELPNLIERDLPCELSDQQKHAYETFRRELVIMVEERTITALNAGAALNKLLQISGGWVYTAAPEFIKLDASPRLNLLRDLIEANERKVIVYAPFRHMVAGIGEFLNSKEGIGANSTVVIGDKDRDKALFAFQDTDQYKCLVGHPSPIGHGNTLTRADLIIWYSPVADYDVFDQANYRIRRIGQEFKQQIMFLQASAADRRLYAILRRKENVQNAFLKLVEELSHGPV